VKGILVAASVIGAWSTLLGALLWRGCPPWGAPLAVLAMTFLHTGLFITAHDAMHGTVAPRWRRLNHAIGALCAGLYALFPYRPLFEAHHVHHRAPAGAEDPDWHGGRASTPSGESFVRWYLAFMGRYVRVSQIVGMAVVFNVLHHALGVPLERLLPYWVLPSLLSTVQLFYFGTFRPHRIPEGGHSDAHRAVTEPWPTWATFLSCYHFGLHHAHHARPYVPWWQLPAHRQT
jgi:beta-carotene ketolase (CrtW type)